MEKTILDYFIIVRKKLWLIALFILLSCVMTYYVSKTFVQPVYLATNQLLVSSILKESESINLNDVNMNLNLIESYKEIIKSNTITETVVANHPEFKLTREQLDKKLKVSSVDKTNLIKIEVEDSNYGKAVLIANEIAQTFMSEIPSLMNVNNVRILSPANPGKLPAPENASIAMNLAVSFILSAMAALGVVFFLENINDTLRSEKEAEHYVGLPVLATIGTIKKTNIRKRSKNMNEEVSDQTYVTVK
ncbi:MULTISPECIES: YveK family protein [Paenibacillus]|uniref:Wzz/FepE/Etk N-terminal domain-containing protein n=1 Tax=Paenibacillus radicis (ex Xue et al. 2023) TaxID=2972489 RepID=A0ABT1YRW9_9BACL|nr:Wzz/FepE/Etk N-terminal domain-containing protein [Paenibacillus radicis (ex Xue et al. 2023)]MCR8635919.1 Wzz/FepE/Etk N-terminal domain-containing protein [Paenibacillus radicis (ex Xue et al. 2023)]